jgi:hypothetical protein
MKGQINSILGAIALSAALAGTSFAGTIVWASASGAETNCGSFSNPCGSLQTAVNNAGSGGTVYIASDGEFRFVSIQQPVSIINVGHNAAIRMSNDDLYGVSVNTTGDILLKGLTIDGSGVAAGSAILVNAVNRLVIEDCTIKNLSSGDGIKVRGGNVLVQDTLIQNVPIGINALGRSAGLYLSRTTIEGASTAGYVNSGSAIFTYRDNIFLNNGPNQGSLSFTFHN